jgi:hypothetical protein
LVVAHYKEPKLQLLTPVLRLLWLVVRLPVQLPAPKLTLL